MVMAAHFSEPLSVTEELMTDYTDVHYFGAGTTGPDSTSSDWHFKGPMGSMGRLLLGICAADEVEVNGHFDYLGQRFTTNVTLSMIEIDDGWNLPWVTAKVQAANPVQEAILTALGIEREASAPIITDVGQ